MSAKVFAKTGIAAAIAFAALSAAPAAHAQNFLNTNLTAMNNQFNQRMNAQMAQQRNAIVQRNLTDPRVMAAYRAGVCGYGLTPQQFAYKYAATGGCTAQGYANYNNTSRAIAANEGAAMQRYRMAQADRAEAMAAQQRGFYNNQYQRGMQLGGWRYTGVPGGTLWYRP